MLHFAAVFGYDPDFPGPIKHTAFETAMSIEAANFLEAVYIASAWAMRHNGINRSDGCRVISVMEVEEDDQLDS